MMGFFLMKIKWKCYFDEQRWVSRGLINAWRGTLQQKDIAETVFGRGLLDHCILQY